MNITQSRVEPAAKLDSRTKAIILASLSIGLLSGLMSFARLHQRGYLASDFQWSLRAGQYLLEGKNPYHQAPTNYQYPYDSPYFYPLTTAVASIPFAPFEPYTAGALFFGMSSALLAFAILRDNPSRLPVFLSAPFFIAASVAQWSPLIMAAALLPVNYRWLAFLKPTLGIIAFIHRPTPRAITIFLLLVLASIIILPTWPPDWLLAMTQSGTRYTPFLFVPGGIILLLSLLAIKTQAGRTLFALSVIPLHGYWYDSLLLWLVPTTFISNLVLAGLSWTAYFGWRLFTPDMELGLYLNATRLWQLVLLYSPLLGLVLSEKQKFDTTSCAN